MAYMGRAERRKMAKRGLSAGELKAVMQQEGIHVLRQTVEAYSVAVAMVLHDKLRFGNAKLHMTLKQIESLFESINQDYISIEDLKRTLSNECGVEFTGTRKG